MKGALIVLWLGLAGAVQAADQLDRTPLEALTVDGEKVRLFPNGRWEYADPAKAAAARQAAAKYPENQALPAGAQGGVFGIGRTVAPGDKDYNRGSLNPKLQ